MQGGRRGKSSEKGSGAPADRIMVCIHGSKGTLRYGPFDLDWEGKRRLKPKQGGGSSKKVRRKKVGRTGTPASIAPRNSWGKKKWPPDFEGKGRRTEKKENGKREGGS